MVNINPLSLSLYTHTHTHTHMCIYIYFPKEMPLSGLVMQYKAVLLQRVVLLGYIKGPWFISNRFWLRLRFLSNHLWALRSGCHGPKLSSPCVRNYLPLFFYKMIMWLALTELLIIIKEKIECDDLSLSTPSLLKYLRNQQLAEQVSQTLTGIWISRDLI